MNDSQMQKCPVFEIANVIGKKWTVVLMQEIYLNGDKGFNFIHRRIKKITPKILSKRLKELEENRLIEKQTTKCTRLKTQYKLTKNGEELNKIIRSLRLWNENFLENKGCTTQECVTCKLY